MMKHKLLYLLMSILFLLVLNPVMAANVSRPTPLDDRGPLTKITFIHYKNKGDNAKPDWAGGNKNGGGSSKCYAFLAKGAKWKSVQDYVINPSNSYGLSDNFVTAAVNNSISQWDAASGSAVFGNLSLDSSVVYDENSSDGINTLSFGPYPEANVIAVTNVWGYFGGPPQTRELVEWDMLLNTGSDWDWGDAAGDANLMDVENIVAHEIGHSAGMSHPDSTCTEETMYAYSHEGEISKRDLNAGDIAGIQELYR